MDRYDVVLHGVDLGLEPDLAAAALREVLDVDGDLAGRAVAELHASRSATTVACDLDDRVAERALHALRERGVLVRLVRRTPSEPPREPRRELLPDLGDLPRYELASPLAAADPDARADADASADASERPLRSGELVPTERDALPVGVAISATRSDALPPPSVSALDAPLRSAPAARPPRPVPRAGPPGAPAFRHAAARALAAAWSGLAWWWVIRAWSVALLALALHTWAAIAFSLGDPRGGWAPIRATLPVDLAVLALAVGMSLAWYRAAFDAGARGARDFPPPDPLGLGTALGYFLSGAALVAVIASATALFLYGWLHAHPWVASLPPAEALPRMRGAFRSAGIALAVFALHAPIGTTLVALHRRRRAYFDPIATARLIATAPLELACVYAAGALALLLALAWIGGSLVALGVREVSLRDGVVPALAWWQLGLALVPPAVIAQLAWGSMGALAGAMARSKPALRS